MMDRKNRRNVMALLTMDDGQRHCFPIARRISIGAASVETTPGELIFWFDRSESDPVLMNQALPQERFIPFAIRWVGRAHRRSNVLLIGGHGPPYLGHRVEIQRPWPKRH
jgi:hypothetical protein